MRNHFLSFLGTGDYEPCRYRLQAQTSSVVTYAQIALLELIPPLQEQDARVSIFLTEHARDKHSSRLLTQLKEDFPALSIQTILIPEGKTPEELWNIFSIIFEQITEGETIFLDITHSFRSLPLFSLSLLNYSRVIKDIRLGGIYYGAFEALGPRPTVQGMPPENRIAPVFDLRDVYTLMEWSSSVHLFLTSGRAEELAELVRSNLKPILSDPGKRNLEAIGEQKLADMLPSISFDLLTNRGEEIFKGESFYKLHKTFQDLQGRSLNLKPLEPLLAKVSDRLHGFQREDLRNGYRGVSWCIRHGWIQQGITQLQETVLTHLLWLLEENYKDRKKREIVSTVLGAKDSPTGSADQGYQDCLKRDPHLTKRVFDHPFCKVAAPSYNQLRDLRNDINHGGFTEETSAARFHTKLTEAFESLQNRYRGEFKEELF